MSPIHHLTADELEAGLEHILASPTEDGVINMIVRRPATDEREVCETGELDEQQGLVGDNWAERGSSRTDDGSAHPDMQLNIMNSRVVQLVSTSEERWPLAGDQIFVDMDLSKQNLPAGTRLRLGTAIIEVTAEPHAGCRKFVDRFGLEAMKFVNSRRGKQLCLRGINARVVQPGRFSVGDTARRLPAET